MYVAGGWVGGGGCDRLKEPYGARGIQAYMGLHKTAIIDGRWSMEEGLHTCHKTRDESPHSPLCARLTSPIMIICPFALCTLLRVPCSMVPFTLLVIYACSRRTDYVPPPLRFFPKGSDQAREYRCGSGPGTRREACEAETRHWKRRGRRGNGCGCGGGGGGGGGGGVEGGERGCGEDGACVRFFTFFLSLFSFIFLDLSGSTVSGFSTSFAVHFSSFRTRSYALFPSLFPFSLRGLDSRVSRWE